MKCYYPIVFKGYCSNEQFKLNDVLMFCEDKTLLKKQKNTYIIGNNNDYIYSLSTPEDTIWDFNNLKISDVNNIDEYFYLYRSKIDKIKISLSYYNINYYSMKKNCHFVKILKSDLIKLDKKELNNLKFHPYNAEKYGKIGKNSYFNILTESNFSKNKQNISSLYKKIYNKNMNSNTVINYRLTFSNDIEDIINILRLIHIKTFSKI